MQRIISSIRQDVIDYIASPKNQSLEAHKLLTRAFKNINELHDNFPLNLLHDLQLKLNQEVQNEATLKAIESCDYLLDYITNK